MRGGCEKNLSFCGIQVNLDCGCSFFLSLVKKC